MVSQFLMLVPNTLIAMMGRPAFNANLMRNQKQKNVKIVVARTTEETNAKRKMGMSASAGMIQHLII